MVAIIKVVSAGNKDSKNAIESLTKKAVKFLTHGVNLIVIDLFPFTSRDPDGIDHLIWEELKDEPFETRPPNKLLTVASYDASDELTAYVNPVEVGDQLPVAPLFLGQRRYVNIPLEATCMASWADTSRLIRDRVEPSSP